MNLQSKDHLAAIARLERENQGLKVEEFVPGKRLVLRRKPRLNIPDLFFRLSSLGFLGLLGKAYFDMGFSWAALGVVLVPTLLVLFFVFLRPVFWVYADAFEIDVEKGIRSQRYHKFSLQKQFWPVEKFWAENGLTVFEAKAVRKTLWGRIIERNRKFLEIRGNSGDSSILMHSFLRPEKSGVTDQEAALNELLESFQDSFQISALPDTPTN